MASMACEVMPLQRYVSGRLQGEPAVPNELARRWGGVRNEGLRVREARHARGSPYGAARGWAVRPGGAPGREPLGLSHT